MFLLLYIITICLVTYHNCEKCYVLINYVRCDANVLRGADVLHACFTNKPGVSLPSNILFAFNYLFGFRFK